MVFISCCKVGPRMHLLAPLVFALCFSSPSTSLNKVWMGSGFSGSYGGRQMFLPVDCTTS